ncbi:MULTISPECIES: DUF6286 domain-containing protein [Actinomadura]|uniref:DUF6286 domain-containing protein n=1 Tax=Actinomadura TaxID=1988 RepID=UPI0004035CA8|nr:MULTISPECIES: DUF6286 domain-containing protein [Actinomadura]RSN54151.1 alkaline shock response membrane anchor protein AmaP [Actinomadura sp. WAC 06369]
MTETLVKDLIRDERNERRARRLAVREFRPQRALAGLTAALLLTALGGVAAVELLAAALGSGVHPIPGADRVVDALHRLPWRDPAVTAGAAATAALGLALVLAGLPGRLRAVPLAGTDARLAGGLGRGDLRRTVADAALAVPGIERARVRVPGALRRRIVVRVATPYHNPANLADLVADAVAERLAAIEPMRRPPVDVRVGYRRG